jgi:MoxR-like ATPase
MAWSSVISRSDTVSTPHGQGTVRRVSEQNKTAQVEVDGQLFEVPLESISKVEETPAGEFKLGDKVQKKENPNSTGTVSALDDDGGVSVKWDANGKEGYFSGSRAKSQLEKKETKENKEQPKEDTQVAQTPEQQAGDTLYGLLKLKEHLEHKIDSDVDEELKELKALAKSKQSLEVNLGDKVNVVEGLKHNQLEQLITYAAMRLSPLLVGMAGTGKTHAAEQVSKALDLPFYAMSVGAQTSKSDIIGYMSASGEYVPTHFRKAYEEGGLFLMDEIDAGNANVLIQVNAALSNGLCAFPDKMVTRHRDFVFIASANTYGNGANRQYVGRNQLDAATLDRFAVIDWLIDDELESNLAVGLNGKAWYMAVRAARDYVAEKSIRALISPRATQKGSKLLNVGQPLEEVINATMLASVPDDKRKDVQEVATKIFEKFASEVPSQITKSVNPEVGDLVRS